MQTHFTERSDVERRSCILKKGLSRKKQMYFKVSSNAERHTCILEGRYDADIQAQTDKRRYELFFSNQFTHIHKHIKEELSSYIF